VEDHWLHCDDLFNKFTVPHVFHDKCSFCFSIKQVRKSRLRITIIVYYFCLIISKYVRLSRINISDG